MIPAILTLAALAAAAPTPSKRQSAINDGVILNYALTLEHLENAFYMQGLANFTSADFCAAGTDESFYNNLKEISKDESTHVSFLTTALEAANITAVQPATYAFGVTDAKTFLAVANVLEGVGVSAYLGAAQFIMNKDYLTAAGSILTVESRHSAYLRENNKQSPFPAPFDIPLDFNEVYSLAAQFITAMPPGNPMLPVMAFPAITASPATVAKPGDKISLMVAKSVAAKAAYFITSTGAVAAPLEGSGSSYSITVPADAQPGQGYLVLTSAEGKPSDDSIVAGPAVIQIADNASMAPSKGGHGGKPWGGKPSGGMSGKPSSGHGMSVSQQGDGQPISQIQDGQIQNNPVQQMSDGQAISQISDGQVQVVKPVGQISDGQPQAPPQ